MGIDRHERDRKPDRFEMKGPRIWLPLDIFETSAWANLGCSAKALLLELA